VVGAGASVGDEALTAKDAKSAKRLLKDPPGWIPVLRETVSEGQPQRRSRVVDLVATESENAAERGPRREEVNVSELTDEYRALLSERRYAVLATQDPEGTIHQTPVWFLFEDGRFYIES